MDFLTARAMAVVVAIGRSPLRATVTVDREGPPSSAPHSLKGFVAVIALHLAAILLGRRLARARAVAGSGAALVP